MKVINNISGLFLLILVFSFSEAAPTNEDPRIRELSNKCHGVEDDLQVVLKYQVPSTDTGKCLMLCFLKELKMFDSNDKYDEGMSLLAFKSFWAGHTEENLRDVNSKAAKVAKDIDSKSGTCEYGYEIMKFINAEFIRKSLITTPSS